MHNLDLWNRKQHEAFKRGVCGYGYSRTVFPDLGIVVDMRVSLMELPA